MDNTEAEDLMWKDLCNRIQNSKKYQDKDANHVQQIQEVDGSFFERFGSLFREQAEAKANDVDARSDECKSLEENGVEVYSEGLPVTNGEVEEGDAKSVDFGLDDAVENKSELICSLLNIDELYTSVLFTIINNVGCDITNEEQLELLAYCKEAFNRSDDDHRRNLASAEQRDPPSLMLNVEVIEAKDLAPKDSNGLSDPFVTLYVSSNVVQKYNTSVKTGTLTPSWSEHFAIPISKLDKDDNLCLEVWDFDPAESIKEKLSKITDVKGVKGISKLIKEIAITSTTGQHVDEFIGKCAIGLNQVPASGLTKWFTLLKKNRDSKRGLIKVRLSFSSEKHTMVAQQEYRLLLKKMLLYELDKGNVPPHIWCGSFDSKADAILTQHVVQSGLTPLDISLCQWSVYTKIHQTHPLSFKLYTKIFDELSEIIDRSNDSSTDDDTYVLWEGVKKLLPYCFNFVYKMKKNKIDTTLIKNLREVLELLHKIRKVEHKSSLDLFPISLYPWLEQNDEFKPDVKGVLLKAVVLGAGSWFKYILKNNKPSDNSEVSQLQHINKVLNLISCDIQKSLELFEKSFKALTDINYSNEMYIFYQQKLCEMSEDKLTQICRSLKKISVDRNNFNSETEMGAGIKLFEIYMALQKFVVFGRDVLSIDCDHLAISNYYRWFYEGVAQWLEIALYKALQRIEKAVELDDFVPLDDTVKISSSAVDTLTIFYQVKVFWQQLNWPDIEGRYTFIAKMIDDICRCNVFYSEKMSQRVSKICLIRTGHDDFFEISNEWCVAINNIEHVCQDLKPFTDKLEMDRVIDQIARTKSEVEAKRCEQTLDNIIDNTIDTVKNEIIELLEAVILKMVPAMNKLLNEGAELYNQNSNSVHRLMTYIDKNLCILNRELNDENFERAIFIVWEQLSKLLDSIIKNSLEKMRPPIFFCNLQKTLDLMLGSFQINNDEDAGNNSLLKIQKLLSVHKLETNELIHLANTELFHEYKKTIDSTFGTLTVRMKIDGSVLHIEILNCRNLIPMDSNGLCDAFVRVHFFPQEKFSNIVLPKTKTHHKTLVPLFDEKFEILLSDEQKCADNALLLFSVKDKDLLGFHNRHVGEAFIHFKDIPRSNQPLSEMKQLHLELSRPPTLNTVTIGALEHRQTVDKSVREFLKKYKQRMGLQTSLIS